MNERQLRRCAECSGFDAPNGQQQPFWQRHEDQPPETMYQDVDQVESRCSMTTDAVSNRRESAQGQGLVPG